MKIPLLCCTGVLIAFSTARAQVVRRDPREVMTGSQCYRYQRDTVSLAGKLSGRVYPGRPNYESVKDGDQPDTVVVLRLDRAICMMESEDSDARQAVREVQLIIPEKDFHWVVRQPGAHMTLKGTTRS